MFEEERDDIRLNAKEKIAAIQQENVKNYNRKRKKAQKYREGDLVVIKRTQSGPGLKFSNKYLGPYRISRIMRHDRYMVAKVGNCEGPQETSTSADHMKLWLPDSEKIESEEICESNDEETSP